MSALTLERLIGLGIFNEDSASSNGDEGQSILQVRQDTLASSTSADGDYGHIKGNAKGELYTIDTDANALLTTMDTDLGLILADTNAMVVDLAALEVLVTAGNAILTTIDADTGAILTDTNAMVVDLAAIEVLITAGNALLTTIDADTSAINTLITDLSKAEDAAHSSGDQGIMGLAVRNDVEGSLVSADGDYAPLQVDSLGRLRIIGDLDVVGNVGDDDADSGNPLKVGSRSHFASAALAALSANGDRADLLSDAYRRIYINDAPNVGMVAAAVSVGLTEVALPASPLAGRTRMLIQNNGNKPIFVGPTGVTTSTGIEVSKSSTLALEAGQFLALYGISTDAAQDVRVFELA